MPFINFSYEHAPQYAFLYITLFVLLLADIQILPLFFDLNVLMVFSLAAFYYWAIYHPSLLPIWALFFIGLLKDLLTGIPLVGISSLTFIALFILVKQQRIFLSGQSFFMIWAGYAFTAAVSCFIFWVGLCLFLFEIAPKQAFAIEGGIMILSFPLIFMLMGFMHRFLPFASHDKASL